MRAMRMHSPGQRPTLEVVQIRPLGDHELLLRMAACGVCRTDLHLMAGELTGAHYPVTPGHEIVGRIVALGTAVSGWEPGERIGVPWLGASCGDCADCRRGLENLCERAEFTGCTLDGGYAEYAIADARYCLSIPERYSDAEAAPLLCAGLIGYRAYKAAGPGVNLGLYGFGAAAHLLAQIASGQNRRVFAFTRPHDLAAQQFARELGAAWAGGSDEEPNEPLDAAIIFAPVGALVPVALDALAQGRLRGAAVLINNSSGRAS